MSKKLHVRDPQAEHELKAYAAVLFVLLVVRIPFVRQVLRQTPSLRMQRRKLARVVAVPEKRVESWPRAQGRESGVSVKPTFIVPNEKAHPSEGDRLSRTIENIGQTSNDDMAGQPVETSHEAEQPCEEMIS